MGKQSTQPAPVVSLPIKADYIPDYHVVKKGESLYALAWIYDIDPEKIIKFNQIRSPDSIYAGEKIYLKYAAPPKKTKKVQTVTQPVINSPHKSEPPKKMPLVSSNEKWIWPANGKIVKNFSTKQNQFNKGIDISGTLNDAVHATKSGKVVYSGEGLRGYGKLIIIKHDDTFLSAYAHNHQLLAHEGDTVKQGQIIAKMGRTDSPTVKLHFQIRKNGQPVDPSRYLNMR